MAAICRSTIIKEGTPFISEWTLRSLWNGHAVYVGMGTPLISEWLRRSAGIASRLPLKVPKTFDNWPVGYINTIRIFTQMIPIVSCFLILEQSFSSAHYPSRINTTFRKIGASFTVISAKGRAMT